MTCNSSSLLGVQDSFARVCPRNLLQDFCFVSGRAALQTPTPDQNTPVEQPLSHCFILLLRCLRPGRAGARSNSQPGQPMQRSAVPYEHISLAAQGISFGLALQRWRTLYAHKPRARLDFVGYFLCPCQFTWHAIHAELWAGLKTCQLCVNHSKLATVDGQAQDEVVQTYAQVRPLETCSWMMSLAFLKTTSGFLFWSSRTTKTTRTPTPKTVILRSLRTPGDASHLESSE